MLNEPFDFNGNFFTSSLSPKIFGLRPKSKSRPKIWIYPYYSLPLPGLILLHNSKVFKLLNNYPPPVVRFVEVFLCPKILQYQKLSQSLPNRKGNVANSVNFDNFDNSKNKRKRSRTVSLGVQKYSYMSCQKSPCHSLA